jgi:hypothetical protein
MKIKMKREITFPEEQPESGYTIRIIAITYLFNILTAAKTFQVSTGNFLVN